jgi:DNA replication and repair protein RecF
MDTPIRFNSIELRNFRSYDATKLDGFLDVNYFIGKNGAGKSNILEALQLVASMVSFRTSKVSECVRIGDECAFLKGVFSSNHREFDISLNIEGNSRNYLYNGKPKKQSELKGMLPTVCFSPDDLMLIKGSSQKRRNEFDLIGEQAAKQFLLIKRDYLKILKQKNSLLKEEIDPLLLEGVNDVFAKIAAKMTNYRFALFKRLKPFIIESFSGISSDDILDVKYYPSIFNKDRSSLEPAPCEESNDIEGDLEEVFKTQLNALCVKESLAKHSLIGPHLDDFEFFIDGRNANLYASQGQIRCVVLALKIAEGRFLKEVTGEAPIILLDDVTSELDKEHRRCLAASFLDAAQVFITSANESDVDEGFGRDFGDSKSFKVVKEHNKSIVI